MIDEASRFTVEYLDRKRRELMDLQNHLGSHRDDSETEVVGGTLVRLARVARALEKMDEGTYGESDISGEAIAEDRLEAMPEATNTLAEQNRVEVPDA